MSKIALFSRTRVILSVAVGLVAFVVQAISVWNTPIGDEPAKIKEAGALLEQYRRSVQTEGELYTVQARDGREIHVFSHTVPVQSRLDNIFKFVLNEREHTILVQIPEYNTTADFPPDTKPADIRAALRIKFPPAKVDVHRSWNDVETASRGLTGWNGLILKARAMQYLGVNPGGASESDAWTNRFEIAQRSFSVCTTVDRIRRSAGFGLLVFVIFTPLTWLALLVLAWIWCFSLDQLRKLSRAVRGQTRRE
ncbi:MAG: hypothetical protein ACLP0A_08110 [Verrucomicrobiia bacterium]